MPRIFPLLFVLGCVSDDEPSPDSTDLGTLDLLVVEGTDLVDFEPIPAMVALDDAAGTRQEVEADEDGLVSFDVDWLDGPFTATVDPGGLLPPLITHHGITKERVPDMIVVPRQATPPATIEVSGEATGRIPDTTLLVVVEGPGHYDYSQGATASYAVQAPSDVPFSLVVTQYNYSSTDGGFSQPFHSWHRIEHTGTSDDLDLDLDLDLSTSEVPGTGSVRVWTPPGGLRQDAADLYGWVMPASSTVLSAGCGWPSSVERLGDNEGYDMSMEWLAPSPGEDLATIIESSAKGGRYSQAYVEGTPDQWSEDVELLELPALDVPGAELHDPFVFSSVPEDARGWLVVEDDVGDLVWSIFGVPGETEVLIPEPPSSVDPSRFEDGELSIVPFLYSGPSPGTSRFFRLSVGKPTAL